LSFGAGIYADPGWACFTGSNVAFPLGELIVFLTGCWKNLDEKTPVTQV
jgi:hypothetical protein